MAIARMTKVSIALHSSEKDVLLKHLQDESALHITSIEKKEDVKEHNSSEDNRIRLLETRLNKLEDTIKFVQNFIKKGGFLAGLIQQKTPISKEKYRDTVEKFAFEEVTERIKNIYSQLAKLKSEKEHLLSKKDIIEPWLGLDTPVELLKPTKTTIVLSGTVNKRLFKEEIIKKAEKVGVQFERIDESKDEVYIILLFHKSFEEEAQELLDEINFGLEDFRGFEGKPSEIYQNIQIRIKKIEEEIEELLEKGKEFIDFYEELLIVYDHNMDEITRLNAMKDAVRTKTTYVIQGWVETKRKETLLKSVNSYDAAMMLEIEPEEDENPPVKLVNRTIFQPFEIVTNLYGTPRHNELDPSPLLAVFFAVFFGICITDAGYGIVLALLALFLMKKIPTGRKFLWLLFIGAIFTIIEGALLGGWFGSNLFTGTFFDKIAKEITLFDPMKSYFVFYRLALALGCIQIYWGLFLRFYDEMRNKNYADAFIEAIVWLAIITSLLIALFASDFCIQLNLSPTRLLPEILLKPAGIVFGTCFIIVLIFGARTEKSPFFRLFLGGLRFTILGGVFSYLGDFLSYIRLMALGLVTAGIANAINDIGRMTLGIPVVGIIIFIIILVGGHLFNLGINTLGGFVHTLRLQYVEFFQKFFIGGGKAFSPLRRNEKYVILKEA
ncbi:MAG: V-type ATP synthase subunit I [Candidatus Cloacimonadota bacterium]|nr:MAG: V-type ATP synthase subunit I [Candidatus Cloacimonadota bacterium]